MKKTKQIILYISITIFLLLLFIILLIKFIAKEDKKSINSTYYPIQIMHAGGSSDNLTYLNSQEVFEKYYNLGCTYFEYDFKLSSDGKLISTHSWEHFTVKNKESINYEEFKQLKLTNNHTPANEEWLVETIIKHPNITIIVDAKMNSTDEDILVLKRIEELEDVYNCEITDQIIPEIFSKDMWNKIKDELSFKKYIFSHYKEFYSFNEMIENFNDNRIIAFSLPIMDYNMIDIIKLKFKRKKILFFTVMKHEQYVKIKDLFADGFYTDLIIEVD